MISIVIPTIVGREDHFARTVDAYYENTVNKFEIVVGHDHPHVGSAWNASAPKCKGDYFLFTADDLSPGKNWDVDAVKLCDQGKIPVPGELINLGDLGDRHLSDGQVVSGYGGDIDTVPFCSRSQFENIGPFLDAHFFTDSYFSHRCVQCRYQMVGCATFTFVHYLASVGRGAGMTEDERMIHDEAIYWQAVRGT